MFHCPWYGTKLPWQDVEQTSHFPKKEQQTNVLLVVLVPDGFTHCGTREISSSTRRNLLTDVVGMSLATLITRPFGRVVPQQTWNCIADDPDYENKCSSREPRTWNGTLWNWGHQGRLEIWVLFYYKRALWSRSTWKNKNIHTPMLWIWTKNKVTSFCQRQKTTRLISLRLVTLVGHRHANLEPYLGGFDKTQLPWQKTTDPNQNDALNDVQPPI